MCAIDKKEFYIRGCLEISVIDGPRPFTWGVWVSLSEKSFKPVIELWDYDGSEKVRQLRLALHSFAAVP